MEARTRPAPTPTSWPDHPNRLEIGLLAGLLGAFMLILAVAFCGVTFALGVLDGGMTTVGALSMVVPIPLLGLADDLLCWVSATLKANLQPHDAVGRFGGDEFVVLLTSSAAAPASDVATRLSAALAVRTPVSVGVAMLPQHGTDFASLYAHADSDLYRRKPRRAVAALLVTSS